jgi:hypothetical protein
LYDEDDGKSDKAKADQAAAIKQSTMASARLTKRAAMTKSMDDRRKVSA